MICPECNGNGYIRISGQPDSFETSQSPFVNEKEITCPICEGQGEISDTASAKHCPACGEPIAEDQEWCAEHQTMETLLQANDQQWLQDVLDSLPEHDADADKQWFDNILR